MPIPLEFLRLSGAVFARGRLPAVLLLSVLLAPALSVAADAERGSALAEGCAACHGLDGNSTADNFPALAAQGERYLYEQMQKIRAGQRAAPLMAGQLDKMSDEDLRDLAAWYASSEATIGQAAQTDLHLSRTLYLHGDIERKIPACSACHGPAGKGSPLAGLPALTGQRSGVIMKSLRDYRSGARPSEANGAMHDIARRLTDEDIAALADFIQGLY